MSDEIIALAEKLAAVAEDSNADGVKYTFDCSVHGQDYVLVIDLSKK